MKLIKKNYKDIKIDMGGYVKLKYIILYNLPYKFYGS